MSTDPGKLKWYEQADAFAKLAEGKTLSGVKNMVTGDGTGNGKVISAGCTITVSEFALAIEDSMKNMKVKCFLIFLTLKKEKKDILLL